MTVLYLLLLLLSAIFFGFAAFDVVFRKVNFLALGLLCWVLVPLLRTIANL